MSSFDSSMSVSENTLADYLLDGAGLSKEKELMSRTACGNRRKFDEIPTALRQEHPKTHKKEKMSSRPDGAQFAWHRHSGGSRRGFHKYRIGSSRKHQAFFAAEALVPSDEVKPEERAEEDEYQCYTFVKAKEYESAEGQID